MSHHLREDNTCQNCGRQVNERYCSHCGQENVESHHTFPHLLGEFVKDITHYEGKFWRSVKYLLLRPARLTQEYLEGRRKSYVAPVRLYIFISFVAFLLPHLLPGADEEEPQASVQQAPQTAFDSLKQDTTRYGMYFSSSQGLVLRVKYKSLQELDSQQRALPAQQRMEPVERWFTEKSIRLQHYSSEELMEKFNDALTRSFPKALFIYMPLFACVIWLFHNKKRWPYFDHAIFTLHYFSFMLLLSSLLELAVFPAWFFVPEAVFKGITSVSGWIMVLCFIVYFFVAHRRMYGEKPLVSFAKGLGIYVLNISLFLVLLAGFAVYTIATLA